MPMPLGEGGLIAQKQRSCLAPGSILGQGISEIDFKKFSFLMSPPDLPIYILNG